MQATPIATSTIDTDVETLYRDGIVGAKGALPVDVIDQMRADIERAFNDAIARPGGAINRGPKRWYVEVNPQQIGPFETIAGHPWVHAMAAAVLGDDYRFVEVGFDVPFQGAKNQPWHRDFRSPEETWRDRKITSLAFNLTGVDVSEDMGPFEIAPGTQFEPGQEWNHGMFPPKDEWPHFADLAVRKFPRRGDISCRTALTIHRGTAHASAVARPVLILGVVAGRVADPEEHDLALTRDYFDSLNPEFRERLLCRIVDELEPVTQRHDIEGLVMGVEDDQPSMMGGG